MYPVPTFENIRDAVLRDTAALLPDADTAPDSDHYVHACRLASMAVGQYAHQSWILRQIFPDTADTEYLERHASLRGLSRKNATYAAGTVRAYGNPGAQIAADTQIQADGLLFAVGTAAQIGGSGQTDLAVHALQAGTAGNLRQSRARFMAAPSGVRMDAELLQTEGGTDAESDASLLARLLELIRRPPAGGNRHDYKNWALSVDGVTHAYVYPLRRGLGTVDIVITSGTSAPSDQVLAACQKYIDEMRPVTAKSSLVLKPSVSRIDVSAQVKTDGISLSQAQAAAEMALRDYFDTLVPGDSLILSQIEAAVSNIPGIADRRIVSPERNRDADTQTRIEWFRLGQIRLSAMD